MHSSLHLDEPFTVVFMTVSRSAQMLLKLEKCIPISHVTLETVPKYANIERPTSSQLYASLQQCVQYFNEGHSYAVIVDMMSSLHGVNISLGTLKSKLNEAGLYRRKDYSSPNSVSNAISDYYSGASSHMYGSSINNQRIESWWSIFRKGM